MDPGVWKKPTNCGFLKRFVQERCGCEHNWTTATKPTNDISLPRTDPWLPGIFTCILLVDFDGKQTGKYMDPMGLDWLINENLRMAYCNPYRTGEKIFCPPYIPKQPGALRSLLNCIYEKKRTIIIILTLPRKLTYLDVPLEVSSMVRISGFFHPNIPYLYKHHLLTSWDIQVSHENQWLEDEISFWRRTLFFGGTCSCSGG